MTSGQDIVIVGAARTPMGAFQGGLARESAPALGAAAIKGGARAGRARGREGRRGGHGLRAAGRARAGAGAAGGLRRRAAGVGALRDAQQGLRLGDEGGDAGARPDRRRQRRAGGRRRHGEHVERALPAREGARRLPHGARAGDRPHVPRRARGRLRQGAVDGHLRRGLRRALPVHPRRAGRVRAAVARPRPGGDRDGGVRGRDRAGRRARRGRGGRGGRSPRRSRR